MKENQRKKGAILSYATIIINTLVQLIYTPFLIKMLGQSEYGLFSLVSSIVGYLTVLDLGFGNAIIVYTSKYRAKNSTDEEKKLLGMFNIIYIVIGFVVLLLGLLLYFNVNNIFLSTMTNSEINKLKIMMLILTFNLFLTFAFSVYSSIISAYEEFVFQKLIGIIGIVLKPAIMIPLLFLGYRSISLTIVMTIINVLCLLSNYIFCKKKLKIKLKFLGFDKVLFKTIFAYSFYIFLNTIVDKINWSADHFILGAVSGTIAVSVYSVASTLNSFFINLSTSISGVLLPKISKMEANNASDEEFTNEFIKIGRLQYIVIFLVISGFILFGKEFILLWAGENFEISYYIALILIIPLCFPLIQNLGLSIMQAKNKYKFKSISTFIMALFNIVISVFLAKKYGAIGAAIGTSVAIIVCNIIIINIYYYKVIKINVIKFWKEILKMTIYYLALPILMWILISNVRINNGILSIITFGGIYTLTYCFINYFIIMNEYEKSLIKKLIMKFKR